MRLLVSFCSVCPCAPARFTASDVLIGTVYARFREKIPGSARRIAKSGWTVLLGQYSRWTRVEGNVWRYRNAALVTKTFNLLPGNRTVSTQARKKNATYMKWLAIVAVIPSGLLFRRRNTENIPSDAAEQRRSTSCSCWRLDRGARTTPPRAAADRRGSCTPSGTDRGSDHCGRGRRSSRPASATARRSREDRSLERRTWATHRRWRYFGTPSKTAYQLINLTLLIQIIYLTHNLLNDSLYLLILRHLTIRRTGFH